MASDPPVGTHSFNQKTEAPAPAPTRRSLVLTSQSPRQAARAPPALRRTSRQRRGASISYLRNPNTQEVEPPIDLTSSSTLPSAHPAVQDFRLSGVTSPTRRKARPASWYGGAGAAGHGGGAERHASRPLSVGRHLEEAGGFAMGDGRQGREDSAGEPVTTVASPPPEARMDPSPANAVCVGDRHRELLTVIAMKERKCLDLREELARHEEDLCQLKLEWQAIAVQAHPQPAVANPVSHATMATVPLGSASLANALSSTLKSASDQFLEPPLSLDATHGLHSSEANTSGQQASTSRQPPTDATAAEELEDRHHPPDQGLVSWDTTSATAKRWVEGLGNLWELLQDKPSAVPHSSPIRHARSASQPGRHANRIAAMHSPLTSPTLAGGHLLDTVMEEDGGSPPESRDFSPRISAAGAAFPVRSPRSPRRPRRSGSLGSVGSSSGRSSGVTHSHSLSGSSTDATSTEDAAPSLATTSQKWHEAASLDSSSRPRTEERAAAFTPVTTKAHERCGVPPAPPKRLDLGVLGSTAGSWGGTLSKRWAELASGEAFMSSKRATLAFVEGLEKSFADALPSPASAAHQATSPSPCTPSGPPPSEWTRAISIPRTTTSAGNGRVRSASASARKKRSDDTLRSSPKDRVRVDPVRSPTARVGDFDGWLL